MFWCQGNIGLVERVWKYSILLESSVWNRSLRTLPSVLSYCGSSGIQVARRSLLYPSLFSPQAPQAEGRSISWLRAVLPGLGEGCIRTLLAALAGISVDCLLACLLAKSTASKHSTAQHSISTCPRIAVLMAYTAFQVYSAPQSTLAHGGEACWNSGFNC